MCNTLYLMLDKCRKIYILKNFYQAICSSRITMHKFFRGWNSAKSYVIIVLLTKLQNYKMSKCKCSSKEKWTI